MKTIELFKDFKNGIWSFGFEFYDKKPMFYIGRMFFDGEMHYCLHLGPLWIECDSI